MKNHQNILKPYYYNNEKLEIGIDEAGRGPLFGRIYTAAVILPKDDNFNHSLMKDSKKFHSKKKITETANYIKNNSISWAISFEDEKVIDEINILQATQKSMHNCILNLINKMKKSDYILLIDGNYFNPLEIDQINIESICIEGGDNKYSSIAAASILAKVERDKYIEDICETNPDLSEKYNLHSNKGYGTKKHLEGINKYGITKWHRKSFGICSKF